MEGCFEYIFERLTTLHLAGITLGETHYVAQASVKHTSAERTPSKKIMHVFVNPEKFA